MYTNNYASIITRIIIFNLFLLLISYSGVAQNTSIVGHINEFIVTDSTMRIDVSYTNKGSCKVFYKPVESAICYGLLSISLVDKSDKSHEIYPCDYEVDLDSISLYFKNSVCLNTNETFRNILTINMNKVDMPPLNREYRLVLSLHYEDVNFIYPDVGCNIFKEQISFEKRVQL